MAITVTNLGNVRRELGDHAGAVEALERGLGIFEAPTDPTTPVRR